MSNIEEREKLLAKVDDAISRAKGLLEASSICTEAYAHLLSAKMRQAAEVWISRGQEIQREVARLREESTT